MSLTITEITCQDMQDHLKANPMTVFVDVREEDEFADGHVTGARNFPLSSFSTDSFQEAFRVTKDTPLYLFCRSGNRSMKVCQALQAAGFRHLHNVAGGLLAWQAAGLPVVHK